MAYEDNLIRSKDGKWAIVIDEDSTGAHFRATGAVPKTISDAVEEKETAKFAGAMVAGMAFIIVFIKLMSLAAYLDG